MGVPTMYDYLLRHHRTLPPDQQAAARCARTWRPSLNRTLSKWLCCTAEVCGWAATATIATPGLQWQPVTGSRYTAVLSAAGNPEPTLCSAPQAGRRAAAAGCERLGAAAAAAVRRLAGAGR
jgi:hypothetical protein